MSNREYRKGDVSTFKEAFHDLIKQYRLQGKLGNLRVVEVWKQVVGPFIDSKTESVVMKNKTLIVKVTSAPLKQEIISSRSILIKNINKEMGGDWVSDIKVY
ncbi:MAG: DUF721 domain-containing protein [Cyclobacteriaceae bacterium]|nr:DUF721 domain-containing protein [Cyclobacteriaceae bacterium]MCH8515076.1 DUF721 domain-containing protein [Cyclobacteriaceae bacterium]